MLDDLERNMAVDDNCSAHSVVADRAAAWSMIGNWHVCGLSVHLSVCDEVYILQQKVSERDVVGCECDIFFQIL